MEKKRSPRSTSSPGNAIFPKSPLVYESYKSGCAWKLINFFDFKHIKSGNNNKRLSSEKKKKKLITDSAGNVYTKSQLDLLKKLHEKCHQCNERIVEEESSCKPKTTRRRSFGCEREQHEKPVEGLLEREIRRIKNLKEETFDSSGKLIERVNDNKDKQMDREEISLRVRVNEETAETLISSKAEEKGKDRSSKQFMEALDILSSNKELFITLLQNPNSFAAKKGQDLERSKAKESLRGDESISIVDDDLDRIVLLKPRVSSSVVDDRVYLRFKHLAKKLKLVVGTNKDIKPECSGSKARETEGLTIRTNDAFSPESPVFRRKKRVESDVFKLSTDNDVLPRKFTVERSNSGSSSPVYEVPNELSSLQTKLKERREKLKKRRESFKLWSLDKNVEVYDPKPHSSGSGEYRSLRTHVEEGYVEDTYLESSLSESNSSVLDPKQEQEQPSPVSVLERIRLEDELVVSLGNTNISKLEEQIDDPRIDLFDKDSVLDFVKKVLKASRLNWTNLMARCNEETSLLDEFSHGNNHNNDQLLLVLDYTDEILRELNRQNIMMVWPYTSLKSLRFVEEDLIQETMRRFDWSLLCSDSSSSSRTMAQIIETDLMIKKKKPCVWLSFGGESEGVVSDVVEKIMQQLVLEISHELRTTMQRWSI